MGRLTSGEWNPRPRSRPPGRSTHPCLTARHATSPSKGILPSDPLTASAT